MILALRGFDYCNYFEIQVIFSAFSEFIFIFCLVKMNWKSTQDQDGLQFNKVLKKRNIGHRNFPFAIFLVFNDLFFSKILKF